MNQLRAWILLVRFSPLPDERLGAWKSPVCFPWLGIAVLLTAIVLIASDLPEARAIYTLRYRMEQAVALPPTNPQQPGIIKKSVLPVPSMLSAYQSDASKRAWNALGLQFQRDPAALFIALENTMTSDVGLLAIELSNTQTLLSIDAEAKSIAAIEEWRQTIAHQPLLRPSRLLKEKWMPPQNGVTPLQLHLEVPVHWEEVTAALASHSPKPMLKSVDKKDVPLHKPRRHRPSVALGRLP